MLKKHEPHLGRSSVAVGQYTVLAGGLEFLRHKAAADWPGDVLIPLTSAPLPSDVTASRNILPLYLPDFGGVPDDWLMRLENVIKLIDHGVTVMAFCYASHGRTGTFLASLIALLEDKKTTPDPIAAVRERHCSEAVESLAQAEAIFALRGQKVPRKYRKTLYQPSKKEGR